MVLLDLHFHKYPRDVNAHNAAIASPHTIIKFIFCIDFCIYDVDIILE